MDWETKLISTYFIVCEYSWIFDVYNERFSNNDTPKFTDSEVATVYIFCTMDDFGLESKKAIHGYADRHLRSWFPELPKYEAFSRRVNELGECFRYLTIMVNSNVLWRHSDFHTARPEFLGDSVPIVMAKGVRSTKAKVAKEIANLGYCATKKMNYHGLKLHNLNLMASENKLPHPVLSSLSSASAHDYEVLKMSCYTGLEEASVILTVPILTRGIKHFTNRNMMSQSVPLQNENEDRKDSLQTKNSSILLSVGCDSPLKGISTGLLS